MKSLMILCLAINCVLCTINLLAGASGPAAFNFVIAAVCGLVLAIAPL